MIASHVCGARKPGRRRMGGSRCSSSAPGCWLRSRGQNCLSRTLVSSASRAGSADSLRPAVGALLGGCWPDAGCVLESDSGTSLSPEPAFSCARLSAVGSWVCWALRAALRAAWSAMRDLDLLAEAGLSCCSRPSGSQLVSGSAVGPATLADSC